MLLKLRKAIKVLITESELRFDRVLELELGQNSVLFRKLELDQTRTRGRSAQGSSSSVPSIKF